MRFATLVRFPLWAFISAVVVILAIIINSSALADVIYSGTNFEIIESSPIDVGVTPLKAVTLTAVGNGLAKPSVFDSSRSGSGGTGITTTGNALYQIWEGDVSPTPTKTLLGYWGTIPQDLDTHFLVDKNNLSIPQGLDPSENRVDANHAENSWGGFGNSLTGTFSDSSATGSFLGFCLPCRAQRRKCNWISKSGPPAFRPNG